MFWCFKTIKTTIAYTYFYLMKYVNNRLLTNHHKLSFLKELLQLTDRKCKKENISIFISLLNSKTHHKTVKTYLAVLFWVLFRFNLWVLFCLHNNLDTILLYIFRPKLILFLKNPLGWIVDKDIFFTKRIFQFNLVFKLFKNTVFEKNNLTPTELYYITGGSARGKKVKQKTWRISAFSDAIMTPLVLVDHEVYHWPRLILSRRPFPHPPGFCKYFIANFKFCLFSTFFFRL